MLARIAKLAGDAILVSENTSDWRFANSFDRREPGWSGLACLVGRALPIHLSPKGVVLVIGERGESIE